MAKKLLTSSEIARQLDFSDSSNTSDTDESSQTSSAKTRTQPPSETSQTNSSETSQSLLSETFQVQTSYTLVSYPDSDSQEEDFIQNTPNAFNFQPKRNGVIPGCNPEKCKYHCFSKIPKMRKIRINYDYNQKNHNEKRVWLTTRCRKQPKEKDSSKKSKLVYFLKNSQGEDVRVCLRFFLSALGKKGHSDKVIRTAMNAIPDGETLPQPSKQGKHSKKGTCDQELIKSHIMSYNPQISHYRRLHAPKKLYLSNETTIRSMYNDFTKNHQFVSYSLYYKIVSSLNISFTKLGVEECETCTKHHLHLKTKSCPDDECQLCMAYSKHKEKYTMARIHYEKDKDLPDSVFSVDLQKIILLPRMPQFKTAIFTPRLITFNETFAPVRHSSKENPNILALWHEASSGRNATDIASAFWQFLTVVKKTDHLVLWLDNCSAQNKNWTLFSTMVLAVNFFKFETITLKFFESGHTFMSADSVHASIEKEMKTKNNIWDFQDFVAMIDKRDANKVLPLSYSDFHEFVDGSSSKKLKSKDRPKLADLYIVQFRKFSKKFFYSYNHQSMQLIPFDFLKKEFQLRLPNARQVPRGIKPEKKSVLCKNLLPLIPVLHHMFWKELPESKKSCDLLLENDPEPENF